jgi:TatD DNase family protein
MIDTHCHLADELYKEDRDSEIQEAANRRISMISSAITPGEWEMNLNIASKYNNVYASIGVDPVHWIHTKQTEKFIRERKNEIVSVGEVGLDHYRTRDHSDRDEQKKAFTSMIELAKEVGVPIQVHSRSAGRSALEVLRSAEAESVHMHAFDGKASLARIASNDLGYYFSIPTSVVRSPQKQKLVKAINIERLLIETDSPVLAPERGERNTPLNLPVVMKEIARILRRDEEELREIILDNTLRLYRRLQL